MTPEELAGRHPRLYHLTDQSAVAKIRKHGLWSTARLVRGCGLSDKEEHQLLRARRSKARSLLHPVFGDIIISDNQPLSEGRLGRLLDDGLAASDWLAMLNSYVFFWAQSSYAENLRQAKNNRASRKALLIFDTLSLMQAHFTRVYVSPLNSGATRTETRRGLATFASAKDIDYEVWRRRRSPKVLDTIKEVVIEDGVPDASNYLVDVVNLAA